MYLVGDIIDAWKIKQNKWRWKQSHTNVIRRVLGHAKRGTRVVYVAGNHDEFLRPFIQYGLGFGNVEVVNQCEHIGADTRHYLVVHGDMFDGITRLAPWIAFLGDKAYDIILTLNNKFNGVICGHIHHAEIKEINGIIYMNDGDWVESMTALVEHHDGQWQIVTWTQETDHVVDDIDSGPRERSKGYSGQDNTAISDSATV